LHTADVITWNVEVLFSHDKPGQLRSERGRVVEEVCGEIQYCPQCERSVPVKLAPLLGLLSGVDQGVVAVASLGPAALFTHLISPPHCLTILTSTGHPSLIAHRV
jgi:hypothetical protein